MIGLMHGDMNMPDYYWFGDIHHANRNHQEIAERLPSHLLLDHLINLEFTVSGYHGSFSNDKNHIIK